MRLKLTTIVLGAFAYETVAIRVATDSPCGVKCGNVLDSTTSSDIVCDESAYTSDSAGVVFKQCITCESTSDYTYGSQLFEQTDLQWMLYNLRYSTAYCLFGDLGNKGFDNNPCITSSACGTLKAAIEIDSLAANASTYSYCSTWDNDQVPKCTECLENLEGTHYLINFLNVLDGACTMRPEAGSTLAIDGDMFSTATVTVTTPTPSSTYAAYGPSGSLSLGGIVGVAIGGAAGVLAILGFCIVCNGKRRRKAFLRRREQELKNWPSPQTGGEMYETPISQRPLRAWDESPISVTTDRTYPRYFSPYSSQYNSPVSAVEGPGKVAWPTNQAMNIGIAMSPDLEHNPHWGDRKGKEREGREGGWAEDTFELQEGVNSTGDYGGQQSCSSSSSLHRTPVLNHPGYGRGGSRPERQPSGQGDTREGQPF